jgi:hypothetical protein
MLSELKMVMNWFKNEPESAWHFKEIRFDDETRTALSESGLKLLDHTARMETGSGFHCYIPCQYLMYMLKIGPFVGLLDKYIAVFEDIKKNLGPAEFEAMLESGSSTDPAIVSLDPYSRDNFFWAFLDPRRRLEAKNLINTNKNTGKKTYRQSDDFVKSVLLASLPVPNVSSETLGTLVLDLVRSPEIYGYLQRRYMSSIAYMFSHPDGDELLFRIMTAIGWSGLVDSLLGTESDAEFASWNDIDRAFLLRPSKEPGNTLYVQIPVYFSVPLGKYVFIKKGLLDTPESMKKVSDLVSGLWLGMSIRNRNGQFYFESSTRAAVSGPRLTGGTNRIFYGAPGTGKSYRVHGEMSNGAEKIVTVFHPDTQHNDFVGALKPRMEKDGQGGSAISYSFRPGPFTCALIQAIARPDIKVFLIIEEINRASAAAVFGELFQLLDRGPDGTSSYSINTTDPDMLEYINSELCARGCSPIDNLRIPSNMSLLATMNSSDQAVMPLDTAFKRRWNFEYLPIDFLQEQIPKTGIVLTTGTGKYSVTWPDFAQVINKALIDCDIPEDRLIGPFFLDAKELENAESAKLALGGKLFIYLWDDVLRHAGHQKIFAPALRTFGNLSSAFQNGDAVFSAAVEVRLEEKGIPHTGDQDSQDVAV